MQIFKALMTSRIYGWTQESVHCLNMKIQNAQYKLLETISESLGYKDKVTIVPKEQKNTEGQK